MVLSATIGNNLSVGNQLQNYRLAIAATAQYTAFHGGQAQAFAEIQNVVADLNEIFEEELSIHFDLVSDTDTVFTDSATDGYTNGDVSAMINQNTPILDADLTDAGYDIGHVFGTGTEGGLAGLGVVNWTGNKGRGVSTSTSPVGPSWLNLVAHEIGHQFGGEHTFNVSVNFGGGEQREAASAYEPASGSTLMSYAGVAGTGNNLQDFTDDYFHAASFEEIQTFIGGAGTPNSTTATGNAIPTVSGGSDFTIPAGTPFELTASGSDADSGDTLTYTWEQLDLGGEQGLPVTDDGSRPLFRSFEPSTDPTRVFPRLTDLVDNVNTAAIGEALPTTTRSLNFRTTVRDSAGGLNSDDVLISVVDTGTPFAVTAPNGGESWTGGSSQTITWDVGGTTANGINQAFVAIDLSLDGGLTYPVMLESSTANDGSHTLDAPNFDTTEARVRIRGTGSIFFDISNNNFTITPNASAPGFTITETGGSTIVGEDGLVGGQATDTYTIARNTTGAGTTTVSVTADGQTQVSTDGVSFSSSVSLNLVGTTAQTVHVRGLDDTVQEGIQSGLITHAVTSSTDAAYTTSTLIAPVDATIADDELQPVVGVDFDDAAGISPPNWTKISDPFDNTYTSLIREDGITTAIDLDIVIESGANVDQTVPDQAPLHSPNLDRLDGIRFATESITLTWSGLDPGTDYNVYLLTSEWFGDNTIQDITITAGVTVPTFTQDTTMIGRGMLVNSGLADSDKLLEADALMVQADANGKIGISVTDSSVGGVEDVILSGAAIQRVGPETIGFSISQSDASTEVSELGTQDTFDVVLTSQPSGNVVIDVTSGDTGEATVSPATLTFDNTNWSVPKTVTVTGVDDALDDGAQTSITTLSIDQTLTTDNDFDSVGDRLLRVLTNDNEALPLVGVDFESSTAPNNSPTNWTLITDNTASFTANDLINEDGDATAIDLTVAVTVSTGISDTPAPTNLPDHPNSLANIGGARYSGGSVILTWADLTPGTEYDLWVFAAENFSNTVIQTVTITGGGTNPSPFTMDTTAVSSNTLLVNNATASPANNLQTDAVRATADGSGEIQIVAAVTGGADFALLNGAAIQEVVENPIVANLSVTTQGNEMGPTDIVYTVTLSETNTTGSAITFDFDDLGTGTATSGSDYTAIGGSAQISVADGASMGTLTVAVTDDGDVESTETVIAQISNPSDGSVVIGTSTATADITDNDFVTPETSVGLDGSNDLLIQDVNGGTTDDTITVSVSGANIRVNDANNVLTAGAGATQVDDNTVDVPIASITGTTGIIVDTLGGDDTLTVDFGGGNFSDAITFNGGTQTTSPGGDTLVLTGGGTFADATFTYINENDGSIDITGNSTINYVGLEPITSNINATNVTLNYSTTAETITVSDAGSGQTTVDSDVGGETTTFNNPTGTLTINAGNTGNDTIDVDSLVTSFPANVVVNGESGVDTASINGAVSLLAGKSLTVNADTIHLPNAASDVATSGTGQVTLTADRNIELSSGSSITTVDGGITLNANAAATATGDFIGLRATSATIQTTGAGDISLKGTGGDDAASDSHYGVELRNGTAVASTSAAASAGKITIDGTGGDGSSSNYGVYLRGNTTKVTSVIGAILIRGQGGAYSSSSSNYGVWLNGIDTISSTGTGGDAATITIEGFGGAGTFLNYGAYLSGSTTDVSSVDGAISITGSGGDGTGGSNYGVFLGSLDAIASTGTGAMAATITINGTGGDGTSNNYGSYISGSSTDVESVTGAIVITGQGGNGSDKRNYGVDVVSADISSTGTGAAAATILIDGTGGDGTTNNYGVRLNGSSVNVTSVDGNITIDGQGGNGSGDDNAGVHLTSNPSVQVSTGTLAVTATAGTGNSIGLSLAPTLGGQLLSIGSGPIVVTADGNGTETDLMASDAGVIGGPSAAGPITINVDSIALGGSLSVQSTGALTISPNTPSTTIGLGGGTGTLNLTDAELTTLVDGFSSITIGDTSAGTGDIDIDTVNLLDPTVIAGGTIHDEVSGTDLTAPAVTFLATVAPGQSPGILSIAGDATIGDGETFEAEIGGTAAGTDSTNHDQLSATGSVTIGTGVTLSTSSFNGFVPSAGDSFTIIERNGGSGTFAGLAEGAVLSNFLGEPSVFGVITYAGGDGDDVVIDVLPTPSLESVVINAGAADPQSRSQVSMLTVTFNTKVDHAALASAFTLTNIDTTTEVTSLIVGTPDDSSGKTVVELTFGSGVSVVDRSGTGLQGNSLDNGNYRLDIAAGSVVAAGTTATMAANDSFGGQTAGQDPNDDFFRLLGDADGNGVRNGIDLNAIIPTLFNASGYRADLDTNGDGFINGIDLNALIPTLGAAGRL